MGKIFILIGPSCSGKDSIFKIIKDDYSELIPITLYTTRPIRNGESNGKEYYFITSEDMNEMVKNNQIIERRDYNTEYGIWSYATSKKDIDLLNNSYITVNTLVGYNQFRKCYGDNVIPLFIHVDDEIRLERAMMCEAHQISPKYDELKRRFLADAIDFSKDKLEAAGISKMYENDKLYSCVYEIEKDIDKVLNNKKRRNPLY